jgi:hypothetical protein
LVPLPGFTVAPVPFRVKATKRFWATDNQYNNMTILYYKLQVWCK